MKSAKPLDLLVVILAATLSTHAFATQEVRIDRSKAMHSAACVIPVGQIIDVDDLPKTTGTPSSWMARLADDLPVSLISIPGTHDAGTALAETPDTRCQVFSIPAQLRIGIRGFDIRLRVVDDQIKVFHKEEDEKLDFGKVMESFSSFLAANPSETILMRVRQESDPLRSKLTFEDAFAQVCADPRYKSLIYTASSRTEIPLLRDVRGKIVVLDNYGKLANAIDYPNSSMVVQDDYDTSDMDKKFHEIADNLTQAMSSSSATQWFVNYTSSSTPAVSQLQNALAVNPRVEIFLKGKKGHLGLVLMNFPGLELIREVIASNY